MASLNSKIIRLKAKEFNKLRLKTLPEGLSCYLLTKIGTTGLYNVEYTLDNWIHRFDRYREQTNVQVATEDIGFQLALRKSSDLAIGVTVCEIFEIQDRDVIIPDGRRPWWQIFCVRVNETFELPELPVPDEP